MKTKQLRVAAGLAIFLVASSGWAVDDELRGLVDESRRVSSQLLGQVRGELVKELERTGPIRAIVVCKYSVPEITSNISRQTGMRVTRVALRPWNRALGDPDPWEQKVLLDFGKRLANGERVEALEFFEKVDEPAGRAFRYMKAIPMTQPCLICHGPVKTLSEGIRAQLADEYPNQKAVEYEVGQVRGGVSVKKGL
ncbi:Tll0287-like domain-containing protein [Dechloromonas sp. A34]|uniref:Tll0287-like domain-containing protein n=1 Tax=Dechloromonas sp. A34 TaxID=447588 RepID=UPI002248CB23|nr:DUF3365 domain-containing protein [Dechloromonas sp. A34]